MSPADPSQHARPKFCWGLALFVLVIASATIWTIVSKYDAANYLLQYKNGLRPWQWLTGLLLFKNVSQLLVHLLFLIPFGILVERRLGWEMFLKFLFIPGIILAAGEQAFIEFFTPPRSGIILDSSPATHLTYLIAGAVLILAPARTLESIHGALQGGGSFAEFNMFYFVSFFIGGDLVLYLTQNADSSSIYFHGFALLTGLLLASFMVKAKIVDCEEEDLYSQISQHLTPVEYTPTDPNLRYSEVTGTKKKKKKKKPQIWLSEDPPELVQQSTERSPERSIQALKEALQQGKFEAVLLSLEKVRRIQADWQLDYPDLVSLIDLAERSEDFESAAQFMKEGISRFEDQSAPISLRLARIQLEQEHRPRQSQRTLAAIPDGVLDAEGLKLRDSLHKQAQALIDDGHIELGGDNWNP